MKDQVKDPLTSTWVSHAVCLLPTKIWDGVGAGGGGRAFAYMRKLQVHLCQLPEYVKPVGVGWGLWNWFKKTCCGFEIKVCRTEK